MARPTSNKSSLEPIYVGKADAVNLFGLSAQKLDLLRAEGQLIEGVHWTKVGAKVLYNRCLMLDWTTNQHAPELHQLAVDDFLASLPSSKAVNKK